MEKSIAEELDFDDLKSCHSNYNCYFNMAMFLFSE